MFLIGCVFFLGAIAGSLLRIVIVRAQTSVWILGRSRRSQRQTVLKPGSPASMFYWTSYPLIEILTGCLFVIACMRHPQLTDRRELFLFVSEAALSWTLFALAVFDLRWRLLPLEPMIGASGLFFVVSLIQGLTLSSVCAGLLVAGGFLGILSVISRGRWLGSGDPWLGVLIGAALGWPKAGLAVYLTYVIGGVIMLGALLLKRIKPGTAIPFAPFLVSGTLLSLWFGDRLLSLVSPFIPS